MGEETSHSKFPFRENIVRIVNGETSVKNGCPGPDNEDGAMELTKSWVAKTMKVNAESEDDIILKRELCSS